MTSSGISGPACSRCSINLCRDGQQTKEYQYFWVLNVEGRISSLANLEPNIHALTCHGFCMHGTTLSSSLPQWIKTIFLMQRQGTQNLPEAETFVDSPPQSCSILIKTISKMDSSTSTRTESFSPPGRAKARPSEHGTFWLWHTEELNFFHR